MKKRNKKLFLILLFLIIPLIIVFFLIIFFTHLNQSILSLGSNLVLNPSMEDSNGNSPAHWTASNTDSTHIALWDSSVSHSGGKSLKMEVLSSTKSWYRWTGDNINVEPNTYYKVEYWYKAENLPPKTGAESGEGYTNYGFPTRAMFEWSEFDGVNPNRYREVGLLIPWTEGNTGWTKMSDYFKTGATTSFISPRFFLYSFSGRVWFDDLTIQKATESDTGNMSFNDNYWSGIKGIGIHSGHYNDVAGMQQLGVTMARDDISWNSVESTTKGVYNFGAYDTRVNQLASVNIEPLLIIDYSNCLYNSMPSGQGFTCDTYVPRDPVQFETFKKAFGNYTYQVVNHFKGKVKYFEIWNEPNGFWQPRMNDNLQATQYIDLMKEAYTRAKEANPDSIILSAGIGNWDNLIDLYIKNYYTQGAKDYFDILAIHPYCPYTQSFPIEDQGKTCDTLANIAKVRAVMDSNGDTNKKIWITEYGYPTDGPDANMDLSEANQNIRMGNLFPTLRDNPSVTAFFWYDYKDDGTDNSDIENRFGLVRRDLSRKPAYYTYQNVSKYQCTEDKCINTTYYQCLNNAFVDQGQVVGKCGVLNPSGDGGGGGGGGGGSCIPNWKCNSSWSTCINGNQTRTCTDSSNCGITTGKPIITQSCTPDLPKKENWFTKLIENIINWFKSIF